MLSASSNVRPFLEVDPAHLSVAGGEIAVTQIGREDHRRMIQVAEAGNPGRQQLVRDEVVYREAPRCAFYDEDARADAPGFGD